MEMEIQIYFQIRYLDMKIGKIFSTSEKNISVLVSRLIEVHHIQISWRSCQKVGKIWHYHIVEEDLCFKDWTRVDGSSGWIVKKKTIKGSSSRQWQIEFGRLKMWRFFNFFSRWVKYCIDRQRVCTKCYMLSVSVSRLLNKWFIGSRSWSKKPIPPRYS